MDGWMERGGEVERARRGRKNACVWRGDNCGGVPRAWVAGLPRPSRVRTPGPHSAGAVSAAEPRARAESRPFPAQKPRARRRVSHTHLDLVGAVRGAVLGQRAGTADGGHPGKGSHVSGGATGAGGQGKARRRHRRRRRCRRRRSMPASTAGSRGAPPGTGCLSHGGGRGRHERTPGRRRAGVGESGAAGRCALSTVFCFFLLFCFDVGAARANTVRSELRCVHEGLRISPRASLKSVHVCTRQRSMTAPPSLDVTRRGVARAVQPPRAAPAAAQNSRSSRSAAARLSRPHVHSSLTLPSITPTHAQRRI
jgi:hypothetical protein